MSARYYTVKAVRPGKIYPRNEHGNVLQAFYVDFSEFGEGVYWRRKEGNAPAVSSRVYGEIIPPDKEGMAPRFKSERVPEGETPEPQSVEAVGQIAPAVKQPGVKPPDIQRQIIRQHSQEMALRYMAQSEVPDHDNSLSRLFLIADQFDNDVQLAGQAASPPTLTECEQALHTAGLTGTPSNRVAEYMITQLPEDRCINAIKQLTGADLDTSAGALRTLNGLTDEWVAEAEAEGPIEDPAAESLPF